MHALDWFSHSDQLPPKGEGIFRVTVGGDWAPIWQYEGTVKQSATAVHGDLLPLFRGSDYNIVNLEAVLGDEGAPVLKPGPCLKSDAHSSLAALKAAPFHAVTLANNHSMDFGPASLKHTLELLEGEGIASVGAGMNGAEAARPLIVEREGLRLGIINCAEGEACASYRGGPGANRFIVEEQVAAIGQLKGEVDLVLVIFHGGREHAVSPPPYVVAGMRAFVDAGADAVIAHHPHVPQGVEVYRGAPIAYSLGNFVFRWKTDQFYLKSGYLAHLDIRDRKIVRASLTPYYMKEEGVFELKGKEREAFLRELKELSSLLADGQKVQQLWDAFGDVMGRDWLVASMEAGVRELKESPGTGVVRWHHYFGVPAHRNLFENGFLRVRLGTFGDSPQWAQDLVRRWLKMSEAEWYQSIE